ncbi:MAG: hypothetical protein QOF91_1631 [Alphaproteobacteria bacterium]|nr:hypothetical protein [Alphaproteobacteria bacterium]
MRRFTRLTNAFSKKIENHALAVALFTTYYNLVRIHKTLRVTPAMAAERPKFSMILKNLARPTSFNWTENLKLKLTHYPPIRRLDFLPY